MVVELGVQRWLPAKCQSGQNEDSCGGCVACVRERRSLSSRLMHRLVGYGPVRRHRRIGATWRVWGLRCALGGSGFCRSAVAATRDSPVRPQVGPLLPAIKRRVQANEDGRETGTPVFGIVFYMTITHQNNKS
jgi:hypothetical protein